jgi:hypothetical protein
LNGKSLETGLDSLSRLPWMAFYMLAQNTIHSRCHPSPVDLKYKMTYGLYLTDTSNFLFSDLGLPRSAGMGTMDFSCFGVSVCAVGSLLAAAAMALSS